MKIICLIRLTYFNGTAAHNLLVCKKKKKKIKNTHPLPNTVETEYPSRDCGSTSSVQYFAFLTNQFVEVQKNWMNMTYTQLLIYLF